MYIYIYIYIYVCVCVIFYDRRISFWHILISTWWYFRTISEWQIDTSFYSLILEHYAYHYLFPRIRQLRHCTANHHLCLCAASLNKVVLQRMATDVIPIMNGLPQSLAPFTYGPDILKQMFVVSVFCPRQSGHTFTNFQMHFRERIYLWFEAKWCIYASVNYAIIGSDHGCSSGLHQAIIWLNDALLSIWP